MESIEFKNRKVFIHKNDISQDIFTAYAREVQNRAGFELDQQALNTVHAQLQ